MGDSRAQNSGVCMKLGLGVQHSTLAATVLRHGIRTHTDPLMDGASGHMSLTLPRTAASTSHGAHLTQN